MLLLMASSSNRDMHLGIATEHAKLSAIGTEDGAGIDAVLQQVIEFLTAAAADFAPQWCPGDVECEVLEMVIKWSDDCGDEALLNHKGLMKHSDLFAMMTQDKNGDSKDFLFLDCARKCEQIRELVKESSGKVTEQGQTVTLNRDDTSECYQRMGESMLTNELLPAQKGQAKFKVRHDDLGNARLSGKQRNWIDMMLRKKLGDKKVATFIWMHGLAPLFDGKVHKTGTTEMLQSALHHGTEWYASLIQSLLDYDADRELERESHKREFEDMTPVVGSQ